jgi:uncharacterized protein (TIGR02266 family)
MTRILVVDDVKLFRHMEASVLGWRGYTIEQAASGQEALEKARSSPPDLVLLDFYMPGMDGTEVCKQIKADATLRHLPVIMVTSSSRDEDIRAAVQAGCDDYLTKPLDDATLIRKVEDLLGSATKRRFPRVSASMQVSFEDFKGIFFEYARDISRTGVFIEMDEPLTIGTRLRLSFALPAPFDHPVLAYGRVVRCSSGSSNSPAGVGVSFIHVDEDSARVIDALVAGSELPQDQSTGVFSRLSFQLDDQRPNQPLDNAKSDLRLSAMAADCVALQDALLEMQRDHLRLSAMLALSEGLLAASDPKRVAAAGADVLSNLLGAESFGIFLLDPERSQLIAVADEGLPDILRTNMPLDGPLLQALQESRAVMPQPQWPLDEDGTMVLAAGGMPGGAAGLGVVTIHSLYAHKNALTTADQQLFEMLCRYLGHFFMAAIARKKVEPLDRSDLLHAFD